MNFVFDMQHPYLQALRAVLRRQRHFKRMGKVYAGIKAPTDPELRSKALMWGAERRKEQEAWDQTRAVIGHLRGSRKRTPRAGA